HALFGDLRLFGYVRFHRVLLIRQICRLMLKTVGGNDPEGATRFYARFGRLGPPKTGVVPAHGVVFRSAHVSLRSAVFHYVFRVRGPRTKPRTRPRTRPRGPIRSRRHVAAFLSPETGRKDHSHAPKGMLKTRPESGRGGQFPARFFQ